MDPAEDDNLPANKQVDISKKMFIGGFLLLPWLWLCNVLFYREYMNKPSSPPAVRFYTKASFVGFLLYTTGFLVWLITFLVSRNSWGASGDQLSVVIPKGE